MKNYQPKSPRKRLSELERDLMLAERIREINFTAQKLEEYSEQISKARQEILFEIKRVDSLPRGEKGDKGDRGSQGIPGKNGKDGKNGVDGKTPTKGIDFNTKADKEELILSVLSRIRTPKDGEDAVVDEEKIVSDVIEKLKEGIIGVDHVNGLRNELTSYRNQMAMKQAGQHGGGDTIVAGTNIQITNLANGTKQISAIGAGTGSVTDVSIVAANGFAGSVANSTTTPAITLTTTITGLLKGNGTAISAAVANTDYQVPIILTTTGSSGAATFDGTTLNIPQYTGGGGGGGTVDSVVGTTNRITVDATDPANPIVDIDSTYVGQTSITTLGTITTGTWNATAIALNKITAVTASRALVSDGSGFISASATTATEIGYVSGVTSAIQTQLNAKQATITFGTGVETALGINVGSVGSIVVNGGALGTPSSGVVTNLTGTASININGTVGATTPTTGAFTTISASTSATIATNDTSTTPRLSIIQGSTGDTAMLFALGSTRSYAVGIDNSASDAFIISTAASGSAVLGTGNLLTIQSSGATSIGTSAAFTTGSIELGNASDTTIARIAAGRVSIEGAEIATLTGTQTFTNKTLTSPVISTISNTGTLTLPTSTDTLVGRATTDTLTNKTLTTPVINGATLNGDLQIDATPNTDDTFNGESTNTFNAGATIAQWEVVYLDSSSTWQLTDADAVATAGSVMVALATEAGTATNPLRVLTRGYARNDAWAWTVGGPIYLSTTTGSLTQTAPSATDDVVRVVGYAVTADVIYWNPSNDWITHV